MQTVTLMGRADTWREYNFDSPELWGCATCLLVPELRDKKFTKVFAFDGENNASVKEAIGIARERNIPIVSSLNFATEKFPLVDIAKRFKTSYFKNTMSYMIAYALFNGYERIFLYGLGSPRRIDYEKGRKYILFWVGVAYGMGVDMRVSKGVQDWLYTKDIYDLCDVTAKVKPEFDYKPGG